ncbi:MAG: WD40 repeat domain-containing protein, partial [Planctomycetota bacterium]
LVTLEHEYVAHSFSPNLQVHTPHLRGHVYRIMDGEFSPCGTRMATAACDATVRIWRTHREDVRKGFRSVPGLLWLSADARHAIQRDLPGEDGMIGVRLVDATTGDTALELGKFPGIGGGGGMRAFVTTDLEMAGVLHDNALEVWKVDTGERVFRTPRTWDGIWEMLMPSPDKRWLAARNFRGPVHIVDIEAGSGEPRRLSTEGVGVVGMAWSPDSRTLLTANSSAGTMSLWDIESGKETVLSGHRGFAIGTAWSGDGRRVATTAVDRTARVWDADTGEVILEFSGAPLPMEPMYPSLNSDGTVLSVSFSDGVETFDVESGDRLGRIPSSPGRKIQNAWFVEDGRIAVWTTDWEIRLWPVDPLPEARRIAGRGLTAVERLRFDLATPEEAREERAHEIGRSPVPMHLVSAAGSYLESGDLARAMPLLERALTLRPRYQEGLYASVRAWTMKADADAGSRDDHLAKALEHLQRLVEVRPAWGEQAAQDESLKSLREHPGFAEAVGSR